MWCEHIKDGAFGYQMEFAASGPERKAILNIPTDWKECPVCKTVRPGVKTLEEKLMEIFLVDHQNSKVTINEARGIAKVASDHFREEANAKK